MPLRQATFWDLTPTSRMTAAVFKDGAVFGDYLHPKRKQYPNDTYLVLLRALRVGYYAGPDNVHLVTYDAPNGKQRITGYAHWIRKRPQPRPQTLYQRFMTIVMNVYNYIEEIFLPDRALDPSKIGIYAHIDRLLKHYLVGHRQDCWYLSVLAVDSNVRKAGQGRQLLTWGLDRAKEEGVPVGLISTVEAEGFYRRCGLTVELGRIGEWLGDDNPVKDVAQGQVFFTR